MRQVRRFTAAESAEVWDRWQRGEALKLIGRAFGRHSSAIFAHLQPSGGIRPAPRRRAARVLSLAEREELSRGLARGASLRSIAVDLGRAASTLSRELRRNGGRDRYRACASDRQRLGPCPAAEAVQALRARAAAADRRRQARAQLVSRADCRVVEAHLSRRRGLSGVARDDLSQPVRPGARRPEEGAAGASALAASDPALAPCDRKGRPARPDHRCGVDP